MLPCIILRSKSALAIVLQRHGRERLLLDQNSSHAYARKNDISINNHRFNIFAAIYRCHIGDHQCVSLSIHRYVPTYQRIISMKILTMLCLMAVCSCTPKEKCEFYNGMKAFYGLPLEKCSE
jgi:hypothetical protein